jgi:amidophosphoribosyltransferase
MLEPLGEKCAVFGVFGKGLEAARLSFFGLYALQHRGQESSGITATDGTILRSFKGMGLVAHVFSEENIAALPGYGAVGHNRYSTTGASNIDHAQPVMVHNNKISLVHNGNLPSTTMLVDFLFKRGVTDDVYGIDLKSASDSEIITIVLAQLVDEDGIQLEDAIKEIFPLMTGSFSIIIMTKDKMIALRDQFGIRPLSLAKLNGGYVVASETCAFYPIGATYIRDINPGEMIVFEHDSNDVCTMKEYQLAPSNQKLDIFEFVYFSRHDSILRGQSVYEVRKNFGRELAKENPIEADVVIPVPETAIPVALGYAQESGIPFELGLARNRYIHRTFIQPEQHIREQGIKMKLTPLESVIKGKRVIVIDDSIVRGTTSKKMIKMLYEAGAKEVHFKVSSPPVIFPDFYGIDTPSQKDLMAANMTVEEIRAYIGATSLNFLSYDRMISATGLPESEFCTSCFTGIYPIDLKERYVEVEYKTDVKNFSSNEAVSIK